MSAEDQFKGSNGEPCQQYCKTCENTGCTGNPQYHLCDECRFEQPECKAENVIFGCEGQDGEPHYDNVLKCDSFVKYEV